MRTPIIMAMVLAVTCIPGLAWSKPSDTQTMPLGSTRAFMDHPQQLAESGQTGQSAFGTETKALDSDADLEDWGVNANDVAENTNQDAKPDDLERIAPAAGDNAGEAIEPPPRVVESEDEGVTSE